jgi:hypothetical protein
VQAVGANSTRDRARAARLRQRVQVVVSIGVAAAAGLIALAPTGSTAASTVPAVAAAATTTSSTIPGPVLALAQFPVQGKCSFADSYGAPRSGGRLHEGVDIIAKAGQYVYAVNAGTLTKKYVDQPGSLSGNGWRLTTSDGTYYFYAHFSGFPPGLAVGDTVMPGQIIGYVGETGNAGTPHLHFEIHPGGGDPVNPTQSVKAIDACSITAVAPVQTESRAAPTAGLVTAVRGSTSVPATPGSPTTVPATTAPAATAPAATAPTTPPATTAPASSVPASSAPAETNTDKRWAFIEPVVVFNGNSSTSLRAGVTTKVKIIGTGIVAATTGVLVRLSATVTAAGSLVVHPCSAPAPLATTLFVEPGTMGITTTPVAVVNGEACITSSTNASAKLTVIAQLDSSGTGPVAVQPTRPLDSRTTGKLAANSVTTLAPASFGATVGTTKAVTATFTIVDPSAAGTLLVGPCGGTALKAPFNKTSVAAFSATVPISDAGLCVSSTIATYVVVDIDALWNKGAPAIMPVATYRAIDSRNSGQPVHVTAVPVAVAATASGAKATAAMVNLTILGGDGGASVSVWNCGAQPTAAVGVVASGMRGTFTVITALTDGMLCIASNQPADVLVDVAAVM